MNGRKNPADLLKDTLLSLGNQELLAELRQRAREVVEYLETGEEELVIEDLVDLGEVDDDWVATVLETLSPAGLEVEGEFESVAHAEEDAHIGKAFRDSLMLSLPPPLRAIDRWLKNARTLTQEEQTLLLGRADVRAAKPYPKNLLCKGVTPLTVYFALEGIRSMVHRARHHEFVTSEAPITIDVINGTLEAGPDPIRGESVVQEISAAVDCDVDLARGLGHWLIPLAWCCPAALDQVQVRRSVVGIELQPSSRSVEDLFVRWKATARDLEGLGAVVKATTMTKHELVPAFS